MAALAIVSIGPRDDGGLHSFSVIFWLAAIPGILAAVSILTLVKERKHSTLKGETFTSSLQMSPPLSPISRGRLHLRMRRLLSHDADHVCGPIACATVRASAGAIAIELYALHNLLYAVGAYPAGALADRFGKRGFLIAAYGLAALMNLLLIFGSPTFPTLVLIFVLAGAGYAFQQSLERAIVADITPIEVRSTGFGILAATNGIGDLVSSAIVGALWTTISPARLYIYIHPHGRGWACHSGGLALTGRCKKRLDHPRA